MELDAALAFVRSRRRGVLATIRADGRPQLSNIIYDVDDGAGGDQAGGDRDRRARVRVSITDSRAKTRNLRRDPRASLYVASDDFWSYVVLEGTAELTPVASDPDDAVADELVDIYRAASGEHPDWAEFRRTMVDDGRLILHLEPVRGYGLLPR